MATLKKTADGKVDKRTKEYKELVERAKKARQAKARAAKTTAKKTTTKRTTTKTTASNSTTKKTTASSIKRRADGKVDLRTKEGRAMAEKMAKARAAKEKSTGGIGRLLKKLLK
ncbi:hypothetical protein LU293_06285 [Moraxella nasovis]|uniref:hypothetical protein n=1 Tax=Moraxella nasovis TaxID=2904121 RepID=UPI001F6117B5|nr:hypothetical protein [Moraxella nasovis]UNU72722.1 hypothetical protein LU293_06285 [Moraxella nasovis]